MIRPTKPSQLWITPHGGEPVDLSSYVSNVEFVDNTSVDCEEAVFAGLKSASMTMNFNNVDGSFFAADAALFKAAFRTQPVTRVQVQHPDGRWQRIRAWLKRRGMRWLKVRHVTWSVDATIKPWLDHDGFTGTAVGPISKGLEER